MLSVHVTQQPQLAEKYIKNRCDLVIITHKYLIKKIGRSQITLPNYLLFLIKRSRSIGRVGSGKISGMSTTQRFKSRQIVSIWNATAATNMFLTVRSVKYPNPAYIYMPLEWRA